MNSWISILFTNLGTSLYHIKCVRSIHYYLLSTASVTIHMGANGGGTVIGMMSSFDSLLGANHVNNLKSHQISVEKFTNNSELELLV